MSLSESLFGSLKYWSSRPEKGVQSRAKRQVMLSKLQAEEPSAPTMQSLLTGPISPQ